jgi:hypothetical protein
MLMFFLQISSPYFTFFMAKNSQTAEAASDGLPKHRVLQPTRGWPSGGSGEIPSKTGNQFANM